MFLPDAFYDPTVLFHFAYYVIMQAVALRSLYGIYKALAFPGFLIPFAGVFSLFEISFRHIRRDVYFGVFCGGAFAFVYLILLNVGLLLYRRSRERQIDFGQQRDRVENAHIRN